MSQKTAVLIPCYNEAPSIAKVIEDFKKELPEATIYVYDNNSTDDTAKIAKEHGAIVRREMRQGKGSVVRRMFREVDADLYVMVDGDDTYIASDVHKLLQAQREEDADMVVGDRHSAGSYDRQNTRMFHSFGNRLVTKLINTLYHTHLNDIMSGYRVFTKEFVKSFPIHNDGFEIETEMDMHALDKKFQVTEVPIGYKERMEGSESKLNTFKDGFLILKTIFWLFKDYKPLQFFSLIAAFFFALSLAAGMPVILEYFETHYITHVPLAVLAVGLMLIAIVSLFVGFVLDTVVRKHREIFELRRLERRL